MPRLITILAGAVIASAAPLAVAAGDEKSLDAPRYPFLAPLDHPQADPDRPFRFDDAAVWIREPQPVIVAGDETGAPPDSPVIRADPNVASSPWAGVVSLQLGGAGLCSGTPIHPRFVVSAGHCVDFDDNGDNDIGTDVFVVFNRAGNQDLVIPPSGIEAVHVHPNFTGFGNPVVNDDIILIELKQDLPPEIPLYPPYRGALQNGQEIQFVGYGNSGFGDVGYTVGGGFTVKRIGRNDVDQFFADDEGGPLAEVYQFDFDGPAGNGFAGGSTLGNNIETNFGGGDSGGPGFINVDGEWQLYCVNTFIGGGLANPPFFGSAGGGVLVNAYLDFIDSLVDFCSIPADLTGDGVVGPDDLAILLGAWGAAGSPANLDGVGVVDAGDLALLLGAWGDACP